MAKLGLLMVLTFVVLATAKPIPEDDQEILKASDTRYYNQHGFWYQRPVNGDDSDAGDDGNYYGGNGADSDYARPIYHHRDNVIPIYEAAGAGWGR